ncbi:MAG: proteasome accessory factor PafA2 family protein [Planctomycetota bacterium]
MPTRLFGIETEYAFAPLGPAGKTVPRERVLDLFFQVARERLCFLPGHGYDLHLANGSRLYLDCGLHPELCTPECANPWDVVRYVKAGEQILTEIAEEMARRSEGLGPIYLSKSNVDYSGAGTTWGCHESYLHRGDPETLPSQLIPFLVSRLVYTGSGGFDSRSGGLHFMVSPRVAHLCHTVSGDSTDDRGIFHTKDESLSACGYHRAHLLCSESLCSEQALWLRVGATALVVALIEAGVADGETVALRAPLEAMARFACDPTCTAEAEARDGRPLTALAIQHH